MTVGLLLVGLTTGAKLMSTTPYLGSYRVGDATRSGEVIAIIHGQSMEVLVFEDANGRINWETRAESVPLREVKVHNVFNRLYARTAGIKNKERLKTFDHELARALFRALCENDEVLAVAHFADVEERIAQEGLVRARMIYAVVGCGTAVAFAVASAVGHAYADDPGVKALLVGTGMGVGGAWVSVVQRAWKLTVRPFELPHYLAFQGATRIVLGAVFGAFVVIAVNAGLLLTLLRDTAWGVAAASFIGGASERIVPELLKGAEDGNLLKIGFGTEPMVDRQR